MKKSGSKAADRVMAFIMALSMMLGIVSFNMISLPTKVNAEDEAEPTLVFSVTKIYDDTTDPVADTSSPVANMSSPVAGAEAVPDISDNGRVANPDRPVADETQQAWLYEDAEGEKQTFYGTEDGAKEAAGEDKASTVEAKTEAESDKHEALKDDLVYKQSETFDSSATPHQAIGDDGYVYYQLTGTAGEKQVTVNEDDTEYVYKQSTSEGEHIVLVEGYAYKQSTSEGEYIVLVDGYAYNQATVAGAGEASQDGYVYKQKTETYNGKDYNVYTGTKFVVTQETSPFTEEVSIDDSFDENGKITYDGMSFALTNIPDTLYNPSANSFTISLTGSYIQNAIYGNKDSSTNSEYNTNYGTISYTTESDLINVDEVTGKVTSAKWVSEETSADVTISVKGDRQTYVTKTETFTIMAPKLTSLTINETASSDLTKDADGKYYTNKEELTVVYDYTAAEAASLPTSGTIDNNVISENGAEFATATIKSSSQIEVRYSDLTVNQAYKIDILGGSSDEFIFDNKKPDINLETGDGSVFTDSNDKFFLYRGYVERNDKDSSKNKEENLPIELTLTIDEENFDYSAYKDSLVNELENVEGKYTYEISYIDNGTKYTITIIPVADTASPVTFKLPAIVDKAGNGIYDSKNADNNTKYFNGADATAVPAITIADDNTATAAFSLDAQAPSGVTDDNISFKIEGENPQDINGIEYYTSTTAEFIAKITDGNGIGIKKVSYEVNGGEGVVTTLTDTEEVPEDTDNAGQYKISLNLDGEASDVTIYVTATDKIGNKRTSYKNFNIDTIAPRITVEYDNNNVNNNKFFKDDRTLTVTVEDITFAAEKTAVTTEYASYDKEGWENVEDDTYKYTVKFDKDGEYTLQIESEDMAGHKIVSGDVNYTNGDVNKAPTDFIIDKTAPVVLLNKSTSGLNPASVQTIDGVVTDFYNQKLTYTITATDKYLDEIKDKIEYTILKAGENTETTETKTHEAEDTEIEVEFSLEDNAADPAEYGDRLKAFTATIMDKAGNPAVIDPESNADVDYEGETIKYTGNFAVVDSTKPDVQINAPDKNKAVNSKGTTYFYTNTQKMTVRITDINLETANIRVTYNTAVNGKTTENEVTFDDSRVKQDGAVYTLEIEIKDGTQFSNLKVDAVDYATNENGDKDTNTYIVDGTAPEVNVAILGDNVESVFYNKYLEGLQISFKEKASGASDRASSAAAQRFTVVVTTKDENIETNTSAGYAKNYYVVNNRSNGIAWQGKTIQNTDSTLTYTEAVTVPADSAKEIFFDLTIMDLAGNKAADYTVSDNIGAGNKSKINYDKSKGNLNATITGDRRRVTSTDKTVPTITLTPNTSSVNTLDDGLLLYAGSMSYKLNVIDPIYKDVNGRNQYSGLESVKWTVTSDVSGLISTSNNNNSFDGEQSAGFTVPVTINGTGETDNIALTVTATDKAGNVITKTQKLAIDNQAPRVTVSYNNNNVLNERYFKEDRLLTLTVVDLNFDPSRTSITTQLGDSGWSLSGTNTWVATVNYNIDGDYTFEMATADKAANTAAIDYTNGGVNAVPQDFTIDKTVPVISISFDNNSYRNGKYYKSNRTATVEITEHNFNAGEVQTVVTAYLDGTPISTPQLVGWSSAGDSHYAQIPFMEDGDFTIRVDYTDLAGNDAQSASVDEFTIDTTLPTAVISNVKNATAYAGGITPSIAFNDINFDEDGYSVVWNVEKINGKKSLDALSHGVVSQEPHGVTVTINDLAEAFENDGIYTLSATITDLAGNTFTTDTIMYSVNRFGSVYTVEDDVTKNLLDRYYTNEAPVLKIRETNPNKLTKFEVTISVNGETRTLEQGKDFDVEAVETDGAWKQYVYSIYESAFMDSKNNPIQGSYLITLYSEDDAGHNNSNRTNRTRDMADANSVDIEFTIDCEGAYGDIDVAGLKKNGGQIRAASTGITVYWEDNNGVARVEIYLNGELVKVLEGDELAQANGQYTINVDEDKAKLSQEVYALITDMAGNETPVDKQTFQLNSNWLILFVNNTPALIGTIAGIVVVTGLIIFLFARRKKKQGD